VKLTVKNAQGCTATEDTTLAIGTVGIGEEARTALALGLSPNPFRSELSVSYNLPKATQVECAVLDLLGREVAKIYSGNQAQGAQRLTFDASEHNLRAGVYLLKLQAGEHVVFEQIVYAQ
jgi:hypothetical protein